MTDPINSKNKQQTFAILYMLTAAFFFCFTEICLKKLNGSLNSIELNFSRYLLAGVVLLPVSIKESVKKKRKIRIEQWKWFMLLGFIGITIVGPFYQIAAALLQAGVTSVIFSCNPIFIAVLAGPILKERISSHQLAAFAVEIFAILILINPFHITLNRSGLAFLFITVLCYSLYAVLGKKQIRALGSVTVTAYSFLCGGLQLLALALLSHVPAVSNFLASHGLEQYAGISILGGYSAENLGWVILLYFGVTIGAYLCWFKAMEYGSTALGSLTYFIKPALSPILAWLFVGEAITGRLVLGILCMLIGAVLSMIKDTR